jgi:hypothetical protein
MNTAAKAFWSLSPKGTGILITGAKENEQLRRNLFATVQIGLMEQKKLDPNNFADSGIWFDGPNNTSDLDAPRLNPTDQNGIIIHGNDPQDILRMRLSGHFVVRRTSKVPEGLAEYYKVPSIVWIEIGPGSPWANPTSCSAG